MWVSVGYRTKDGEMHVLHIVGGEEASAESVGHSPVPIYLERDDQSLSCYGGAEKISVTKSSIVLMLNKNGRDSLELPKSVEIVCRKPGRDFKEAWTMFAEMKKRHGGDVLHVVT